MPMTAEKHPTTAYATGSSLFLTTNLSHQSIIHLLHEHLRVKLEIFGAVTKRRHFHGKLHAAQPLFSTNYKPHQQTQARQLDTSTSRDRMYQITNPHKS
jgi:hypothetical protein